MYIRGVYINYKLGDKIQSKTDLKELGTCTDIQDSCIYIDGKCWGGAIYFEKSEWTDFEIVD